MKKLFIISTILFSMGAFAQKNTHTVEKGDNPYNIAKKYGMTLDEFFKLNPKAKDAKLNIGDVLVIKGKATTPKSTTLSKTTEQKPAEKIGYIILKPKQTIYGITKQYHITETELRKLNPELDQNMKIGSKILLPAERIKKFSDKAPDLGETIAPSQEIDQQSSVQPIGEANQTDFSNYTVQDGDTTLGIINKFGMSIDELVRLNPGLTDSGLKPGMVLKTKKIEQPQLAKKAGPGLDVVIMLPFGYDSGDSKYRAMSLDFLSGAKLAIERNVREGQQLNVNIVDAGSEETFKNSLSKIQKNETDIIIGPLFKSSVLEVLNYTKGTNIPVVAPFANSSDLYDYDNLVIIETNENVYAQRIVKEVAEAYSDQKIYIVGDESKEQAFNIKSGLESVLKNPNILIVSTASEIMTDTNMMTGQSAPVIAVLASNNDDTGVAFANRIAAMAKEVQGVKAFSMYYTPAFEKLEDKLREASLVYLMDRKIDSEGDFEKEILADYISKYCKSPSKYAVIGFDIVNDMLSRENSKGELYRQIGKSQKQLATKFEFVRSKPNGAYLNTGYRVVRLVP